MDGRVISIIGDLGIKSIDFWMIVEKQYFENGLNTDEPYKYIEALVGLAQANRGTNAFL